MILITSGAYLEGEFSAEVGLLPPSFLPLGNKRLYEYQVAFLKGIEKNNEDLYISVPASFNVDAFDARRLDAIGARLLKVPDGLSLGDSVLYSWNATAKYHESLTLLHGDTFFLEAYFSGKNSISVHKNRGFYKRATIGRHSKALEQVYDGWSDNTEKVVSGFFRFDKPLALMRALVESKSDFVQAVASYHQSHPMALVSDGEWLDFGHINSFFQSRTLMTTQRVFNELNISLRKVSKTSKSKSKKIYAEGRWFSGLPKSLRLYTPALLEFNPGNEGFKEASYQLEYLYLLPLSDLFVFSRLPSHTWDAIISAISEMLFDFRAYRPIGSEKPELEDLDNLYLPKTIERLKEYSSASGEDVFSRTLILEDGASLSLIDLAEVTAQFIQPATDDDIGLVHGDLCFSNILFDSRTEAVKCIDPRGITPSGRVGLYGDRRYDLAKIYHSIIGFYDFIISGRYKIIETASGVFRLELFCENQLCSSINKSFKGLILDSFGYSEKEIMAITIHLFLSMLPLHSDRPERQRAFILNAVRLYEKFRKMFL